MIKSMNGLTLRFFKYNKFTSISSMLSILLSIFLIITISSFSLNAKQSLIQDVKKMYGDMDLAVGYNIGEKNHRSVLI
jgi:putative ABC transport system permease protein